MLRFNLRWLFAFSAVLAVLLALSVQHIGIAYLATCFVLPIFFAITVRRSFRSSHINAVCTLILAAICISSAFVAYGSYYRTFTKPSVGYLIGDGWGSVGVAALFGAVVGLIFGLSLIPIYFMLVAWLGAFKSTKQ